MQSPTKVLLFLIFLSLGGFAAAAPLNPSKVIAPPPGEIERLSLDPFYKKYHSVAGFPIVASEKVNDYALIEAAYLINRMIGHRPDILRAITKSGVRLAIMAPDEFTTKIPEHSHLDPPAYWDKRARGVGATPDAPAVSCGEENLLGYTGDPYAAENILIHEFAHVIHLVGLKAVDPTFQKRLEHTFNRASLEGLWRSKYAGTNPAEYWAEGVQSWFDTNRENDYEHNHVNTRKELIAHDPRLAKLVEEVFGNPEWKYTNVKQRLGKDHLAGYTAKNAPTFSWPADVVKAYEDHENGVGLAEINLIPLAPNHEELKPSPPSRKEVSFRINNKGKEVIELKWIDYQGGLRSYGIVDPKRNQTFSTFVDHRWLIEIKNGKKIGVFAAPAKNGKLDVK